MVPSLGSTLQFSSEAWPTQGLHMAGPWRQQGQHRESKTPHTYPRAGLPGDSRLSGD